MKTDHFKEFGGPFEQIPFKEFHQGTKQQTISDLTRNLEDAGFTNARKHAIRNYKHYKRSEYWQNNRILAILDKKSDTIHPNWRDDLDVWHLSFKYHDQSVSFDWREIQLMKNQICGEDIEMLMLWPHEKRLVDTSNQFHLWGSKDVVIPFGWSHRLVENEAKMVNTSQRINDVDQFMEDQNQAVMATFANLERQGI